MAKDAKKIIKEAKLKVTPARLLMIEMFSDFCKPLSAEDIFKKTRLDLVTIYRTLSSFERAGILKKVNLQKNSQYYEISNHHHHHIICTDCGLVEEFNICEIDKITKKVTAESKKFGSITEHSLELFGTCKNCFKMQ